MSEHFTARATGIAVDKLVYIKSTSGIDHEVGIADAGDATKLPVVGIVDAVISSTRVRVRTAGTHFTGDSLTLTPGARYYAPSPGGVPTTTPGAWVVGVALSTRQLLLGIGGQFPPGSTPEWTIVSKTGPISYTAAFGDYVLCTTTGGTVTITLPTAVGNAGKEIAIKRLVEAGTLTVNTTSSQTIDGDTTIDMVGQYESLTFVSDGANWVIT